MQLQNLQTNAKINPNLKCTFDYYSSYSTVLGLNKVCMVILAKKREDQSQNDFLNNLPVIILLEIYLKGAPAH